MHQKCIQQFYYRINGDYRTAATPQPFYFPFSGTTRVSRYQKRTPGLHGAREKLTEADTPTIRLGATPSGLTSAHLHHPHFLQAGCPSCRPTNSVKALKAVQRRCHRPEN